MTRIDYSEYIKELKKQWIGKKVKFENQVYTVVGVDYNGFLLIDKQATFTDTTTVATYMVAEV